MRISRSLILILIFLSCIACSSESNNQDIEDLFSPSNKVLLKPGLKVLDIGNSFTNDATACLPLIVKELGVDIHDMCLYKATKGGASFKDWYLVYNGQHTGTFDFRKVIGDLEANIPEGRYDTSDNSIFRKLLTEEVWDVIIIHQLSTYATDYEVWQGHGDGGYLTELLRIIKDNQPSCTLGWLLIHSPADNYRTNKEHSSLIRWAHTADASRQIIQNEKLHILIPYGTAIQNLRSTKWNNEMALTREGLHLGYGLAQYTAACCYYEALLAPRTGVSILGKYIPYFVKDDPAASLLSVTPDNFEIAQKSAVVACLNPYVCVDPDNFQIEALNKRQSD